MASSIEELEALLNLVWPYRAFLKVSVIMMRH